MDVSDRRTFLKAITAAGVLAAHTKRTAASDRVRLGMIGAGLIGTRHLIDFAEPAQTWSRGDCRRVAVPGERGDRACDDRHARCA